MKKIFTLLLMLVIFVACSDNKDDQKDIILDKGTPTSQTIYSDDTSIKDGISFTAADNWVATVNNVPTRATNHTDWIELSQYSGGTGRFSLAVNIKKNYTGTDRKAEIIISCATTKIKILIEQKAVSKEEEENPDVPTTKKKVKTIKVFSEAEKHMPNVEDMYLSAQGDITYDKEGRISYLNLKERWFEPLPNGGGEWEKRTEKTSFSYKKQDNGNLMVQIVSGYVEDEEGDADYDTEYLYCDNTGKVVSAKSIEDKGDRKVIKKYQYVYNNQNQLIETKRIAVENTGAEPYTSFFTWSNHNLVAYKSTSSLNENGNISYSDIKNDANIDLAYLICFGSSTEQLAFLHGIEKGSITGLFGKRVANMPNMIKATSKDAKETYTYDFKRDDEGCIKEVYIKETFNSSSDNYKVVIEYMD